MDAQTVFVKQKQMCGGTYGGDLYGELGVALGSEVQREREREGTHKVAKSFRLLIYA